MALRARSLGPILALLAVSCGGGQPAPTAPPPAPAAGDEPRAEVPAAEAGPVVAAPDLSPVRRPEGVVLLGRIRDPGVLADAAVAWSKAPYDWRARLGRKIPGMDRALHTSAPIELVGRMAPGVSLERGFELAFTVGLRDPRVVVDGLRGVGEAVEQTGPGSWRFSDGGLECAITASVGAAPSRAVCAHGATALESLLPYATRGLPLENLGAADAHLELLGPPLQAAAGPDLRRLRSLGVGFVMNELATDSPALDAPLGEIVQALADELLLLVDDFEKLTVDLALADGGLRATVGVDLRSRTSWMGGTLAAHAARAGAPPEIFHRLPADVADAGWTSGGVPERTAPLRRALGRLVQGAAVHAKLPPLVGQKASALVDELWESAPIAYGTIPVASAPAGAPAELEELARIVGTRVLGIEAKSDRYRRVIEQIVALYQDPSLRKAAAKQGAKAADFPKVTKRASKLVKGATVWEVTLQPKPVKGKTRKAVSLLTLVLAPDGERTWIAFGVDEAALSKTLQGILAGASPLRGRPGATATGGQPAIAGGFLTIASSAPGAAEASDRTDVPRILGRLPHRGQTPIPYLIRVEPRGAGVRLEEVVTVPREAAEDLGVFLRTLSEDEPRAETTASR
ncbi:MAG: hypothetical protein IT376_09160 [Polyangiaceae bacterium]|nr:hypothetical protein [Polyangiaceae bacterium]